MVVEEEGERESFSLTLTTRKNLGSSCERTFERERERERERLEKGGKKWRRGELTD